MNKNEKTGAIGLGADSTKIEREFWGKRLFFAAWTFEILAAAIGIIIAWVQTVDAASSMEMINADVVLAPLPFVMVAAVELLKIPFAYLVYINRHMVTRIVFSFCLVAISFLTFETLITGLERQFTNITSKVNAPRMALENANFELEQSKARVFQLNSLSMDDIYIEQTKRLKKATEAYNEAKALWEEEFNQDTEGRIEIKNIRLQISAIIKELSQIESNRKSELGALNEEYEIIKKNIDEVNKLTEHRIEDVKKEIDRIKEDIKQKEEETNFLNLNFPLNKKIDELKDQLGKLEIEIARLYEKILNDPSKASEDFVNKKKEIIIKYQGKVSKLTKEQSILEAEIEKIIINTRPPKESINKKDKIEKENERRVLEITEWRSKKIEEFKIRGDLLRVEQSNFTDLKLHINDLKLEIQNQISNSQVYRIAYLWYGHEDAVNVTKEEAATIAAVWFGSIAGVVATMGVFLAFGSFILRHPNDKYRNKTHHGGSIRRFFVLTTRALRKRLIKPKIVKVIVEKEVPKEVIKEVPVEKVVTQVVEKVKIVEKEVPVDKIVEVIKTRIVHVPIYTNNPDLINKSNKDSEE